MATRKVQEGSRHGCAPCIGGRGEAILATSSAAPRWVDPIMKITEWSAQVMQPTLHSQGNGRELLICSKVDYPASLLESNRAREILVKSCNASFGPCDDQGDRP